jgi:hypothetical protein
MTRDKKSSMHLTFGDQKHQMLTKGQDKINVKALVLLNLVSDQNPMIAKQMV